MQQLQALVEAGRVRACLGDDWKSAFEVRDVRRAHQRFARAHPITIALEGIDFAVVGHHPVRMGQRPRGKRVGGKAAVHQGQG